MRESSLSLRNSLQLFLCSPLTAIVGLVTDNSVCKTDCRLKPVVLSLFPFYPYTAPPRGEMAASIEYLPGPVRKIVV